MDKDLVWVRKDVVEQIKNIEAGKAEADQITKLFTEFKNDIDQFTYDIEDVTATFRRQAQKVKESFKQVVDEEITAMQMFWEEQDARRSEIRQKLATLRESFSTVKEDIISTQKLLQGVNIYGLDNVIDLVIKIDGMSDKDKGLLEKVFQHPVSNFQ